MRQIQELSQSLANQIAAGEVVERPASVVKELVENAIDAEASEIMVEVEEGGIYDIKVIDNGLGMTPDNLVKSILPHATSKIQEVNDLFQIRSLGFRGEALASIGSVAKLKIESTPAENPDQGYFINVENSKIIDQGPASPRPGTIVRVSSLFYNTPARLKHLKTIRTELQHIISFVQRIALAYPEIRFTLISNGERIFQSAGNGDLRQTIANVYQPQIARQLVEIEGENFDFEIKGYISPPQLTRSNRNYIHWIVNGRTVKDYQLDQVLINAYGRQLMIGRYPIAVILVESDPRLVDVNVHPTKETIRMSNLDELTNLVSQVVEEKLFGVNPVPKVDAELFQDQTKSYEPVELDLSSKSNPTISEQTISQTKSDYSAESKQSEFIVQEEPLNIMVDKSDSTSDVSPIDENDFAIESTAEEASPEHYQEKDVISLESQAETKDTGREIDFKSLRYLGQIHLTYLVAEGERGFYLIDQHAAAERIRYEQFMKQDNTVLDQQELLIPIVFTFSASEMNRLEVTYESLRDLGIYLEQFGPTSYQLTSYPVWINFEEVEQMVYDLIEVLVDNPKLSVNEIREEAIVLASCRGAIKANHQLSDYEAKGLIEQLGDLKNPFHCPHGRPVFIEFDIKSIEKMFKRIQDPHEGGKFL